MFNSYYGETLKVYQHWVSSTFRSPAVPERPACAGHADRVRNYLLHLAVESPAGKYQTLWPHQREAVLRAIFANEVLNRPVLHWFCRTSSMAAIFSGLASPGILWAGAAM